MAQLQNECFYCSKNEHLFENRIFVKQMRCSILYLTKDQHYLGRCILAFDQHKREVYDLTAQELNSYSLDLVDAARALQDVFHFDKLNYAVYGDEMPHLNIHLVPKYKQTSGWGHPFRLDQPKIYLEENRYPLIVQSLQESLSRIMKD